MSYKLALLGEKLGHSFSPIIHKIILEKSNIDMTYELIECHENELEGLLNKVRSGEYKGFNVTIPYKEKVLPYLDEISPEAKKINACNTICMKDGKLVGFNTDYFGFYNEVKNFNIDLNNRKCHILGCGGASKAMAHALIDLGAELTMAVRDSDLPLTSWFKGRVITLKDLVNEEIDVICNATPVGMYPNIDNMPVDVCVAEKCNIVFDAIYNPSVTKLMSYAKESYNGLYMLILQAVKADEIFFDIKVNNILEIIDDVKRKVI